MCDGTGIAKRVATLLRCLFVSVIVAGTASSALAQTGVAPPPSGAVPLPSPFGGEDPNNPLSPPPVRNDGPEFSDPARGQTGADGSTVEISRDLSILPEPVRRMRELIIEAARSGDPEKLRPLIGTGAETTRLSLGDIEGDPVEYLRSLSGDQEGQEILAILIEVLEAGYVRFDAGTDKELFVWPYFFAVPLEGLSPQERVELFTLVTAGDYEDMLSFGAYIFFRVGITPQGQWLFFVAGD